MRIKISILALVLAGCTAAGRVDRPPVSPSPVAIGPVLDARSAVPLRQAGAKVLFWSQAERDANFPHMERLFPGHVIDAPARMRPLPAGRRLAVPAAEIDAFIRDNNVAGLIVLDHGHVRLERYARGLTGDGLWPSFSVAKSLTSTLVGAAIRDGYIGSLSDPVTRYIPELVGSAYDGVTVEQVLTMTSGVRWNEDYTDPGSDVARMNTQPVPAGQDPIVSYLRALPREAAPGTKWAYKTGETNLIGVLVSRATKLPLANYASARIAGPAGFERNGFWLLNETGQEIGGCCISLSLRDYARMGQFVLDGGKGQVPDGWFDRALAKQQSTGKGDEGYGYQWWTVPGWGVAAGIYGQSISINRAHQLVVVILSAWPQATDRLAYEREDWINAHILQAVLSTD